MFDQFASAMAAIAIGGGMTTSGSEVPRLVLNESHSIPQIGLGMWQTDPSHGHCVT